MRWIKGLKTVISDFPWEWAWRETRKPDSLLQWNCVHFILSWNAWLQSFPLYWEERSERLWGGLLPSSPFSWGLHRNHKGDCFLPSPGHFLTSTGCSATLPTFKGKKHQQRQRDVWMQDRRNSLWHQPNEPRGLTNWFHWSGFCDWDKVCCMTVQDWFSFWKRTFNFHLMCWSSPHGFCPWECWAPLRTYIQ